MTEKLNDQAEVTELGAAPCSAFQIPLWAIAGGVNDGTIGMICWITAAFLSMLELVKTIATCWISRQNAEDIHEERNERS